MSQPPIAIDPSSASSAASTTADLPNLLSFSETDLRDLVAQLGWPPYRVKQILRWLYAKRVRSIDAMTDLSQDARATLAARTTIRRLPLATVLTAGDGTQKFLFTLEDGLTVESILIPDADRRTLCVSSQVGCTFDCGFCLTGTMGLLRNLKTHEIVDQVLSVQDRLGEQERLTNIVFMGMGEPLANFDATAAAIAILTNEDWGVGLAARRITLSTAGMASRIADVAPLGVNLAISLNATTEAQRARLMPSATRTASLRTLMQACRQFPLKARDRLTFEYVLLAGENDSLGDATRLVALLRGLRCKVNLIPFNPFPENPLRRPSEPMVLSFQSVLRQAGIDVFIRKSKGRDVLGACGQLGRVPAAQTDSAASPTTQAHRQPPITPTRPPRRAAPRPARPVP
ncbi:MAG: 23S rRNA (adenine(2503)-C(2))-methyltransferase RlmN [Nitrospiraceae bacterium]